MLPLSGQFLAAAGFFPSHNGTWPLNLLPSIYRRVKCVITDPSVLYDTAAPTDDDICINYGLEKGRPLSHKPSELDLEAALFSPLCQWRMRP